MRRTWYIMAGDTIVNAVEAESEKLAGKVLERMTGKNLRLVPEREAPRAAVEAYEQYLTELRSDY